MIQNKIIEDHRGMILMQYAAGITSTLVSLGYNAMGSWTSPALPYLTSDKVKVPLSTIDFDSIATASTIGSFFGYIVNPLLVKYFGTKWTLLIFGIPQIISWLMLVFDEDLTIICISRFISGLAYCGALSTLVEYLTAISNSTNRGILFTILNLSSNLGSLTPITIILFLTYFQMNIILTIIPIIFFLVFLFMPNSSYFIKLNKWKEEEMKINSVNTSQYGFDTFRTAQKDFIADNISITQTNDESKNIAKNEENNCTKVNISENYCNNQLKMTIIEENGKNNNPNIIKSFIKNIGKNLKESQFWKLFMTSNNRRALLILTCVCSMDILGGHIPILTYTQQFLTHSGSIMNGDQASFLLTIIKVIAVLFSTQFTGKMENKKLLLIAGIIGSCSLAFVGLFFFLQAQHYDITQIGWFPLIFITISEIANAVGIGNVFYSFQGVLFSPDVQTLAISVSNIIYMSIQLIALMKFQELLQILGFCVIFCFFSLMAILMPIVIFIIGPDTKGKTLEEIQLEMMKK